MLQIVYYIPLLMITIPENFLEFMRTYLAIAQIKIPIGILPQLVPDSLAKQLNAITPSISFKAFGFESVSFLIIFYQQLFAWLLLLLGYIILSILDWLLPQNMFLFIRRWKKDYTYNVIIRTLIETYLELIVSSSLNIYQVLIYLTLHYRVI